MVKIAPSLLSANWDVIQKELDDIVVGGASWVHFDVMDGKFVPATTFTPEQLRDVNDRCGLISDVHIMVVDPIGEATKYAGAGADIITFHYEATDNPKQVIDHIRSLGCKVGISLKPATPLDAIIPFIPLVDLVLVMTVEPGKGGQAFMEDQVQKIKELKNLKAKFDFIIEVDGGINDTTSKIAIEAGADVLVAGSYVFKAEDRTKAIRSLIHE